MLRATRDRLPPELAAHLGAQLPLVIRGTYYDQYRPSASTEKTRSLETFLSTIADELKFSRSVNTKEAVQVACSVPAKHERRFGNGPFVSCRHTEGERAN